MRIAVLGGGPGGLFSAALAKSADPSGEVTVFERNRADDTFGFGVVFSDATLAGIHEADPVLREALTEHGRHWDDDRGPAEGRADPLRRQRDGRRRAPDPAGADAGPRPRRRRRAALLDRGRPSTTCAATTWSSPPTAPTRGSASSSPTICGRPGRRGRDRDRQVHLVRHRLPVRRADLRPRARPARRLRGARLPDRSDAVSTFIVETDEASWRSGRAGRVRRHPAARAQRHGDQGLPGEAVRRPDRRARGCWSNNSRWGNFRTRRTERWHTLGAAAGRVARRRRAHRALLGRLGHQDGDGGRRRARRRAGRAPGRPRTARWPPTRRPPSRRCAKIQDSARPSLSWWEHFGRYHDAFEPWQFAYHFLSRSISDARLRAPRPGLRGCEPPRLGGRPRRRAAPDCVPTPRWPAPGRLVEVVDERRRPVAVAGNASLPLGRPPTRAPGVRCWPPPTARPGCPVSPHSVGELARLASRRCWSPSHGGTALTRTLLCEQARLQSTCPRLLIDPDAVDDAPTRDRAVTAVLSGRADLVGGTPDDQHRSPPPAHRDGRGPLRAVRAPRDRRGRGLPRPGKLGAALARSLSGFAARGGHLGAGDTGRDETMHPSLAAAAEAGPLDLAMICVPAAACRHGAGRRRASRGRGRRWSAPAGSPRRAGAASGTRRTSPRSSPTSGDPAARARTLSGFLAPARRADGQLRARRRPGPTGPGRGRRGQRRGQPRPGVPAGRGRASASASRSARATPSTSPQPDVLDAPRRGPATPARSPCTSSPSPTDPALVAAVRRAQRPEAGRRARCRPQRHRRLRRVPHRRTGHLLAYHPRRARARPARCSSTTSASSSTPSAALSATRARRPPATPGSASSPPRPGPGCCLLDDLRGRRARVPELTRRDPGRARHPAAAPDLPGQPGRHRAARPRASHGSSHAVAADPHVDLVAAYALHEPDAVDLVAAARTAAGARRPAWSSASAGSATTSRRSGAPCSRPGSRWPPSRAGSPQRSERCSPTPASSHGSAAHRRPPDRGAHRCRPARTTNTRRKRLLDRIGHHHAGPPGLWRSRLEALRRLRRTRRPGRGEDPRRRRAAQDRDRRRPPRHRHPDRARRGPRPPRRHRRAPIPGRGDGAGRGRPGRRRPPRSGLRPDRAARARRNDRRGPRRRRHPPRPAHPPRRPPRCPTSWPAAHCSTGWRGGPVLDPAELGRVAARAGRPARGQPRPRRDRDQPAAAHRRRPDRAGRRRPDPSPLRRRPPMPTPDQ